MKTKKQTQEEFNAKKPVREIFGIVNAGVKRGFVYVHGRETGHKDSNSVANLLLMHIFKEWKGEDTLILYLDNCGGQNKNKTVLGFLFMLVEGTIFSRIHLCFMVPGHTKFEPDQLFGAISTTLKNRSWLGDQELLAHVATVQYGGKPVAVQRVDETRFVDISAHLSNVKFVPVKGIQKQRELVVTTTSKHSGAVWHQENLSGEFRRSEVQKNGAVLGSATPLQLVQPEGKAVNRAEEVKLKAEVLKTENITRMEPEVAQLVQKQRHAKEERVSARSRKEENRSKARREREEIRLRKGEEKKKRELGRHRETNSPEERRAAKQMRKAAFGHRKGARTSVGSTTKQFDLLASNEQYRQQFKKRKRRKAFGTHANEPSTSKRQATPSAASAELNLAAAAALEN